jgi:hypothetical protein
MYSICTRCAKKNRQHSCAARSLYGRCVVFFFGNSRFPMEISLECVFYGDFLICCCAVFFVSFCQHAVVSLWGRSCVGYLLYILHGVSLPTVASNGSAVGISWRHFCTPPSFFLRAGSASAQPPFCYGDSWWMCSCVESSPLAVSLWVFGFWLLWWRR